MELYSERGTGCDHRFKRKSCTLHFWEMAWVCVSRRSTFCHVHLESKWVIGQRKCHSYSFYTIAAQLKNKAILDITWKLLIFHAWVFLSVCRPHACGPRAVLRLHPVCSGVKWARLYAETSPTPHRYTLQAGPEVGTFYLSTDIISNCFRHWLLTTFITV